jgi:hypothetical protein
MDMCKSPNVYYKACKTLIVNYKSERGSRNFYISTLYEREEFCKERLYIATLYVVESEMNLIIDISR